MKYIDAEKLLAVLERQNVDKKVIQPLIRIIDSLQQGQPSLPGDLDEAAEEYMKKARKHLFDDSPIGRADDAFKAGAEWAMHYQEKKIADAYEKGKQEGIRVVRSWESSPGQCGY